MNLFRAYSNKFTLIHSGSNSSNIFKTQIVSPQATSSKRPDLVRHTPLKSLSCSLNMNNHTRAKKKTCFHSPHWISNSKVFNLLIKFAIPVFFIEKKKNTYTNCSKTHTKNPLASEYSRVYPTRQINHNFYSEQHRSSHSFILESETIHQHPFFLLYSIFYSLTHSRSAYITKNLIWSASSHTSYIHYIWPSVKVHRAKEKEQNERDIASNKLNAHKERVIFVRENERPFNSPPTSQSLLHHLRPLRCYLRRWQEVLIQAAPYPSSGFG